MDRFANTPVRPDHRFESPGALGMEQFSQSSACDSRQAELLRLACLESQLRCLLYRRRLQHLAPLR